MLKAVERNAPATLFASAFSISCLQLVNFRNFSYLALEPESRSVVLVGRNGSGKTTILEALSLLAPGRGLRGAPLGEIERRSDRLEKAKAFAGQPWAVSAMVCDGTGMKTTIGTGRNEGADSDKRVVKIDGVMQRGQGVLTEKLALCWLTPQMSSLFMDGTVSRRAYLDRLVPMFYPEHVRQLAIYDHARAERQRLLRQPYPDTKWLDVLERRMAEQAVAIAAARRETVHILQEAMTGGSGAFPVPDICMEGFVEEGLAGESALTMEENLIQRLTANRSSDAMLGRTEYGTHRSDFKAYYRGLPAGQCSTGEQKAILLAITLASARARRHRGGDVPVLLLDEVVAHLDNRRRSALFEEIGHLGAQSWLTGTDRNFFKDFRPFSRFFLIENGMVSG